MITGNQLARLANNPVLRRRMFTTPAQKAAMARGAFGVNASGPQLIKASSTMGMPPETSPSAAISGDQATGGAAFGAPVVLGAAGDAAGAVFGAGPAIADAPPVPYRSSNLPSGSRGSGEYLPGLTIPQNEGMPDTKPKGPDKKAEKKTGITDIPPDQKKGTKPAKSVVDDVINSIANMTGTEEQASKKTRKQKFQEAKDFLVEAGVTQAKDVRTDRDFLMMLGGLKFAAGSGTGSMSQDAVAALSSVLGTFASGKQEERQLEQKLNMAAVESVMADERADKQAATARQLAMDKLAITAQLQKAEMEQDPKVIREARALVDAGEAETLSDALAIINATGAKKAGFQEQTAAALILRGVPRDVAYLIAGDPGIVDSLSQGDITAEDIQNALDRLSNKTATANTGSIPLTGTEDQTS